MSTRRRLALFVLAILVHDCRCSGGPPATPDADPGRTAFGRLDGSPSDLDLTPHLALARAILTRGDRAGLPAIPDTPGRRAFLTVYPPSGPRLVATGLGDSLAASVMIAATSFIATGASGATGAAGANGAGLAEPFRLQLDVVTELDPIVLDSAQVGRDDIGTRGFAVVRGGKLGYVLPTEIVADQLFRLGKKPHLEMEPIRALIADGLGAATSGLGAATGSEEHAFRFQTESRLESLPPGRALAVSRATVLRTGNPTPADLLEAVRLGANYLCRVTDADGRFQYLYHPTDEREDTAYDILRHAGATYAIFEAYDEFATPLYLAKGESALGYLRGQLLKEVTGGLRLSLLPGGEDEEQRKVGGAGLALLAFTKHAAVTGSRVDLETMRSLGRLIVHQQYPDGHFRSNADLAREVPVAGKKLKPEVIYYAGEAILGLLRLYAIDPDPRWLAAARKGADYCVLTRDAGETEDNQDNDHWLSYALNELYREVPNPIYPDHAFQIARAILLLQARKDAPEGDLVGSFYHGASTPTAVRIEAWDADIELSRFLGKPDDWIVQPASEAALFLLQQQFGPDSGFFLKDPAKASGGVRQTVLLQDIRIDYVQHSMSAWLHLARILRDPGYGKAKAADPPHPPLHAHPAP